MKVARTIFLFLVVMCIVAPLQVAQADDDDDGSGDAEYERAQKLWHEGKFQQALPYFERSARDNPDNQEAQDNLAKLYVNMHRYNDAARMYREMARTEERPQARDGWKKLELQMLDKARQGGGASTYGNAPGGSAGSSQGSSTAASVSKFSALCDRLITVQPPQAGRPAVNASMIGTVKSALRRVPTASLEALQQHNIKIVLTPTLIDRHPEFKNKIGEGYDGKTLKQCPGMFNGRELIICQNTINDDDDSVIEPLDMSFVYNTTLHEFGHSIDYCKGELSETEAFKHAYLLDAGRIPPEDKHELAYFLQNWTRGQSEAFAELVCVMLGGNPRNATLLQKDFPGTISLLRQELNR